MSYRAATVFVASGLAIVGLGLTRCYGPGWYHVAMVAGAVVIAAILAVNLAKSDASGASQAMENAREAQKSLGGFLSHRGLSTGITPVTMTSESLRDALTSPLSLVVLFALGIFSTFVNSESLLFPCGSLAPKAWLSLLGEFLIWTVFGQAAGLALWQLLHGRKK